MPSSAPVLAFAGLLCRRLEKTLLPDCAGVGQVLEISTLTTYMGASHRYLHRDPLGVICLFAAVDDVAPEQGGTVFVPGSHKYCEVYPAADRWQRLFRMRGNLGICGRNIRMLWRLRRRAVPANGFKEMVERLFSARSDDHQSNLLRFLSGRNDVFSLFTLAPTNGCSGYVSGERSSKNIVWFRRRR